MCRQTQPSAERECSRHPHCFFWFDAIEYTKALDRPLPRWINIWSANSANACWFQKTVIAETVAPL